MCTNCANINRYQIRKLISSVSHLFIHDDGLEDFNFFILVRHCPNLQKPSLKHFYFLINSIVTSLVVCVLIYIINLELFLLLRRSTESEILTLVLLLINYNH